MSLRYLLDTNVLSEATRPVPDQGVLDRVVREGDRVATAAPVWHEIEFGLLRLPTGKRRRALEEIVQRMTRSVVILPYDEAAAGWHARERARLVRGGRPPAFVDGQIAAIAAIHGLALVTRNVRDFSSFRGLEVESWFSS
jgi:tRNA(fMet)-specific endonuclease VapC